MKSYRRRSGSRRRGRGFSLLEVILAMAILGGALVIIGTLVNLGYKHALAARLRSEANILCDTKMAEVASGVLELESVSGGRIEESPAWNYSVLIEQSGQNGLLLVNVRVANNQTEGVPITVDVSRFMPDPDYDPTEDAE